MSELAGKLWAVLSERGCEASGLAYAEAVQFIGALKSERISGLCVITDEAARRLKQAGQGNGKPSNEAAPGRKSSRRKIKNPKE